MALVASKNEQKPKAKVKAAAAQNINKQGKHSTYNYRTVHARLSFKQEL